MEGSDFSPFLKIIFISALFYPSGQVCEVRISVKTFCSVVRAVSGKLIKNSLVIPSFPGLFLHLSLTTDCTISLISISLSNVSTKFDGIIVFLSLSWQFN